MTKGRDIAADSIGDLLEIARLQQRNGLLRAESYRSGYQEEGEIYVLAGESIYARVGMLTGQQAFHYLLSWRNIYFAFSSDIPRPPANIVPSARTNRVSGPLTTPSMPTMPTTPPSMPTMPAFSPSAIARGPRWNPMEEYTYTDTVTSTGTFPQAQTLPGMTWLVPHKTDLELQTLTLTRRQRLIYFLVDGQRSVGDLARTTGKTSSDVELILRELQEQGLVRM